MLQLFMMAIGYFHISSLEHQTVGISMRSVFDRLGDQVIIQKTNKKDSERDESTMREHSETIQLPPPQVSSISASRKHVYRLQRLQCQNNNDPDCLEDL